MNELAPSAVGADMEPEKKIAPPRPPTRKQRRAARAIARSAKGKAQVARMMKLEEHRKKAAAAAAIEPPAPELAPLDAMADARTGDLSPLDAMAAQIRARKTT